MPGLKFRQGEEVQACPAEASDGFIPAEGTAILYQPEVIRICFLNRAK